MVAKSTSLRPASAYSASDCAFHSSSDWTLLNHANAAQVLLLLSICRQISLSEARQYCDLLASYHCICRPALLRLRAEGHRGACPPPTAEQLQQIAELLPDSLLTVEQISTLLQTLAMKLRES